MQREFLQEKSLNRAAGNAEKSLDVNLSAKSRLLPYSSAADMLGLNDLYIKERDECTDYRMVFSVNPVCTNVLFNTITEPVYMEGSYSAVNLADTSIPRNSNVFSRIFPNGTMNKSGESIDHQFAIRDTEISHEDIGNFKYHCGYDIFNNHLLRSMEFEHVQMDTAALPSNRELFNTIFDFAVDRFGNPVYTDTGESKGPLTSTSITNIMEKARMYQLDTIKTFNVAYRDGLRLVDGWYGFYNVSNINIPNGNLSNNVKDVSINRVLNNEPVCGFVDMYPDRSLFNFIPKINRYKRRIEQNWDCTIVYPYKSDYEMFNRVMLGISDDAEWEERKTSPEKIINAIRVLNTSIIKNNVGDNYVQMCSMLRHSLKSGDTIRLFYCDFDENGKPNNITRFLVPVTVSDIGDAKGNEPQRYFTIRLRDLSTFCELNEGDELVISETGKKIGFFYKKISGGYEDRYYFRKFKKVTNRRYVQIEESKVTEEIKALAVPATREPEVIKDGAPKYIRIGNDYFLLDTSDLKYTQNKIAFGENIYGDRIAQVIFTDDISVAGLKDNLGRPLSSVYFTTIKTNRGHKEWYEDKNTTADTFYNLSADTIEYSHCFGDVTSGVDMPEDSGATEYNVRKLYNVFTGDCASTGYTVGLNLMLSGAPKGNYSGTPMPLETGITMDSYSEFYGDIVEFSKADYRETVLEKVYHRFNTAQRECLKNKNYFDVYYDDLVGDIYDVDRV